MAVDKNRGKMEELQRALKEKVGANNVQARDGNRTVTHHIYGIDELATLEEVEGAVGKLTGPEDLAKVQIAPGQGSRGRLPTNGVRN